MIFFIVVKTRGSFDVLIWLTSTIKMILSFFKESMDPPPGHTFVNWLLEDRKFTYDYESGNSTKSSVSKMTKDQLKTKLNTNQIGQCIF